MMAYKKPAKGSLDVESNNILFIEGLSPVTSSSQLNELFTSFPGFKETRHIVEKMVAFVEFDDDHNSSAALSSLDGFSFKEKNGDTTVLRISFAKRWIPN